MNTQILRHVPIVLSALALAACGAAGGGGDDGGSPTEPTDPPDEIVDGDYANLNDRSAPGSAGMAYVLLEGQTRRDSDAVSIVYSSGAVSGGLLNGTDVDDATYTNPANGEFSRIVRITADNVFGAVGLDVLTGDLPTAGTVTNYNEGWVGMTAAFETDTLVLTGDAEFTATWGTSDIDGRFFNLSGRNSGGGSVTNVGTIILTNGTITGDNFTGGTVSGTGQFAQLGGSGTSSSQTGGTFFGPQADELGGVILINDVPDDILVVGAFQAD